MKKSIKRLTALLLMVALFFTLPTIEVQAATKTVTKVKTLGQIKGKYDYIADFCEGMARVKKGEYPNEKYGFINTSGKEVIKCKYDHAGDFKDGFAVVRENDGTDEYGIPCYRYGVIDKSGKEVIKCQYEWADYEGFFEGLLLVKKMIKRVS